MEGAGAAVAATRPPVKGEAGADMPTPPHAHALVSCAGSMTSLTSRLQLSHTLDHAVSKQRSKATDSQSEGAIYSYIIQSCHADGVHTRMRDSVL